MNYNKNQIRDFSPQSLKLLNDNFDNLFLKVFGNIGNADILTASIDTLQIKEGAIDHVRIGTAEIVKALINDLTADVARIHDLEVVQATINNAIVNTLQVKVAAITSAKIAFLAVDTAHIANAAITSAKIANSSIGNAHISNLDADKLSAGILDTAKVTIQGPNGRIRISNNRIQVFDYPNKDLLKPLFERVVLGNVNGDDSVYGLRLRGADGHTILFDDNGLHEEGITDGAITNAKISSSANIDGAKLDIATVITRINSDNSTSIKGSKVFIDNKSLVTKFFEIENRLDSVIETWYYPYEPTLNNYPANEWLQEDFLNGNTNTQEIHVGDLFYDKITGYSYRFINDNNAYKWIKIVDSDVTLALQKASQAQDTADGKRRVFVVTPITPYEVGDLWAGGSTGDLMRCINHRAKEEAFQINDWEKASKYTDDTAANFIKNVIVPGLNERITNNETSIIQQAGQIVLKASQTSLDTTNSNVSALTTRMVNSEASLSVQAGQIALKASQVSLNDLTSRVSTAESKITHSAIISTVSNSSMISAINDNLSNLKDTQFNRNMLLNTSFDTTNGEKYVLDGWSFEEWDVGWEVDKSKYIDINDGITRAFSLYSSNVQFGTSAAFSHSNFVLKANKQYIFSVSVYSLYITKNTNADRVYLEINNYSNYSFSSSIVPNSLNTWERIYIALPVTTQDIVISAYNLGIFVVNIDGFWINSPMLYQGTLAENLQWQPNVNDVGMLFNSSKSTFEQTAEKMDLLVSGTTGNYQLKTAEIMLAINSNGSTIKISADKVNIEGKVTADYIKNLNLEVGNQITMGSTATIKWANVVGTENIPLRTDLTWSNLLNKPTNLLTQPQLVTALSDYVTTGTMSSALANTINTTNFSTIITKDYIATMNLVVGKEILMGATATINWANVLNKPTLVTSYNQLLDKPTIITSYTQLTNLPYIPSAYSDAQAIQAWVNSGYKTYINANGVYTGSVVASQISAGNIEGCTLKTVTGTQKGIILREQYLDAVDSAGTSRLALGWDVVTPFLRIGANDGYDFKISNSGGITTFKGSANGTNFVGPLNFSQATVTGLVASVIAKFG